MIWNCASRRENWRRGTIKRFPQPMTEQWPSNHMYKDAGKIVKVLQTHNPKPNCKLSILAPVPKFFAQTLKA